MVATNGDLDYAVVKLDPAAVTPTANFACFPIKQGRRPRPRLPPASVHTRRDFSSGQGTRSALREGLDSAEPAPLAFAELHGNHHVTMNRRAR